MVAGFVFGESATAGPSATLRFGRDDKARVAVLIGRFSGGRFCSWEESCDRRSLRSATLRSG